MSAPRRPVVGARLRLTALLDELGVDEPLTTATDLSARLGVVQGVLADRVVDLAVTENGRLRILAELRGRRWAEERGIGVPSLLAAADDGRWLFSARVRPAPPGGSRWTGEGIAAAARIAPLPGPSGAAWVPPPGPALARARASVRDYGRLVRGGVRLPELRAVRSAARQLPRSEMAHGDFRSANLVFDEEQDRLVVLDWSGLGAGPRHLDLLTLWATAPDEADRRQVAEAVLDRTAGWEVPDVGLLWHAVALEQVVARLTRPDRGDGLDAGFARARLAEARRLAQDLGSPTAT
jgi:hypothetical protein